MRRRRIMQMAIWVIITALMLAIIATAWAATTTPKQNGVIISSTIIAGTQARLHSDLGSPIAWQSILHARQHGSSTGITNPLKTTQVRHRSSTTGITADGLAASQHTNSSPGNAKWMTATAANKIADLAAGMTSSLGTTYDLVVIALACAVGIISLAARRANYTGVHIGAFSAA